MQEQFQKIFQNSNEGLIVVNKDGIIETINPKLLEMFGYLEEEELVGQKLEILIPKKLQKDHVQKRESYHAAPRNRSMGVGGNLAALRKDGSEFPVEISLSYYKDNAETKVIGFIIDITKRVEVEEELIKLNNDLEKEVLRRTEKINEQNKLLKSIAENFPNGNIYVINRKFKIEWADGKILRNLGLTDKSLVGVSFLNRLPDNLKKTLEPHLNNLLNGNTIKFEIEEKGNYYSIYGVPLSKEKNRVDKALLVEMDITIEKINELTIEKNLAKEKELNELKSRFVAMASHEFRTPLSTIDSSATLIGKYEDTKFQEKRAIHVDRIKRTVSNLTMILNDFLSLEKLESGKIELNYSQRNLHDFLSENIEEVSVIKKSNQTVTLKEFSKDIVLKTDFNVLKNCVLNLLSNALKYSEQDGEIILSVRDEVDSLKISIQDFGIGIPLADQDLLFSRFHRAGNVTNIEGTGLGLNIVQRYLNALGGKITFISKKGAGSTFTLHIPKKH